MSNPQIMRREDLRFGTLAEHGPVDPAPALGRWVNAKVDSKGILEVLIEPAGEQVSVRILAAHPDGPVDWGEAQGTVFACIEENDVASVCVLTAYDFGFMEVELQLRLNKGILPVTSFNRFKDGSGRSDYVTRELYHRARDI